MISVIVIDHGIEYKLGMYHQIFKKYIINVKPRKLVYLTSEDDEDDDLDDLEGYDGE
jgi:hypothetical protein